MPRPTGPGAHAMHRCVAELAHSRGVRGSSGRGGGGEDAALLARAGCATLLYRSSIATARATKTVRGVGARRYTPANISCRCARTTPPFVGLNFFENVHTHTHSRGSLLQLPSLTAAALIPPRFAATSTGALSTPAASTSRRRAASKGGELPVQRGRVRSGSILGILVPPAKHPTREGGRPDSRLKSWINDAGACHRGGAHSGVGSTLVRSSETGVLGPTSAAHA